MKKFVQILDRNLMKDFEFLSYHKDVDSAGYILSYYNSDTKKSFMEEWFLERDDFFDYVMKEYSIEPDKWVM